MRGSALLAVIMTVVLLIVAAGAAGLLYARVTGFSARATPGRLETSTARWVRHWGIPGEFRDKPNPVPRTADAVNAGMAHFADHCATCHANDGSGDTVIGRGLFPPAPDMRKSGTQSMTDGELFYIIEHGVRFTGMPAWGSDNPNDAALGWQLVHFIRHMPRLSPAELQKMEALNPRSPEEFRQQLEEQRFLQGGEPPAPPPHEHGEHR
jgi:mono/diheme cytochrome c family protein